MDKLLDPVLNVYEKRKIWFFIVIIICIISAWLIGAHKINVNIESLETIANLSLAIFGINGAFITFFITLDNSEIFKSLKNKYHHLYKDLLNRFKYNMIYAVILNLSVFLILTFRDCNIIYINVIVAIFFIYILIENLIGFLYLLDITNNLITKKKETENKME